MIKSVNKKRAIQILRSGFPVGFPTDTLPAIGCLPEFAEIVYVFKKRDKNKALILMGSDISQVISYVDRSAKDDFLCLTEQFWPGPLTIVVPISEEKKSFSEINTIGLRIPKSLTAQSLLSETGPLYTSSANISGLSTSLTAHEVSKDLPNLDLLGPIPWEECSGKASTVISWVKGGKWELIRQGEISISNINQCH
tara:strand:- start:3290 stop:3877 length:588 start_codon:yes stop_codon:yes gene_type:complete